jgi:endonuclease YncB( thermonuclease family)
MYQGSIDVLGDCRMEPWDVIYIADTVTNMWGTANIRDVTHTISADMGYVTQVAVAPMVGVDDPAQWAVSTVVNDFFKRIFGKDYNSTLSQKYYGMSDVEKMMAWVDENPDGKRPTWYDVYVGAGVAMSVILFVAACVITVATGGATLLVGSMGATGLGGLMNPEAMAGLAQYFDEQQDVWVSLLTKNGEPYQAGLTGATGIVIGRQKSVGLDVLDLFAKERPILTESELYKRMGLTDVELKLWQQDMQLFRGRALADVMTQEIMKGVWNKPKSGYIVWPEAVVTRVIDGDTIEVRMPDGSLQTVRFAGLDTPEVAHPVGGGPPVSTDSEGNVTIVPLPDGTIPYAGVRAWDWVNTKIPVGSTVKIYIHPQFQKEKYGRWMGFVEAPDGTSLNEFILLNGLGSIWGGVEE